MAIFTTKYDLDDELYFLSKNKIKKGYVVAYDFDNHIYCNRKPEDQYILEKYTLYSYGQSYTLDVKDLFRTEEELIQSLKS